MQLLKEFELVRDKIKEENKLQDDDFDALHNKKQLIPKELKIEFDLP